MDILTAETLIILDKYCITAQTASDGGINMEEILKVHDNKCTRSKVNVDESSFNCKTVLSPLHHFIFKDQCSAEDAELD